jgi:hypothetical protein
MVDDPRQLGFGDKLGRQDGAGKLVIRDGKLGGSKVIRTRSIPNTASVK